MRSSSARLALGVVGVWALAGCGLATSDAASPPTIGIGTDLDGAPDGTLSSEDHAKDAEKIDAVVMIGDSITEGSRDELGRRFAEIGLDDVEIQSQNGKRMVVASGQNPGGSSIAEFLSSDTDHADEIWVVALGTNDLGQYAGPDEMAAAVNEVLAAVPDESPLVWVDTYWRDRSEQADLLNAIIRERVGRRGNGIVAPWSATAPQDGVLSFDGVHPNDEGADVFALVVTDTVSSFLGR